jgi:hypothetical protein
MKKALRIGLSLSTILILARTGHSQSMKIGETLIVNNVSLKKGIEPESFQNYFDKKIAPSWTKNEKGNNIYLFRADRGDKKGSFLLICTSTQKADRTKLPPGSPFTDKVLSGNNPGSIKLSGFITNPDAYTEYQLIGPEQLNPLPVAGLLGIHYIKVKKDSLFTFEKFVKDKLNPAVGQLLPDLQLLYFKAIGGGNTGSYLTIFVLTSGAARDKYWPSGKPETEALTQAFRPLKALAKELGSYLVEDSYLKPESGGAAAYFESLEWTDFVNQNL